MSSINPDVRSTLPPERSSSRSTFPLPETDRVTRERGDETRDPLSLRKRDKASEVLAHVAARALEHPPRDLQKLTASATKFLLINLEPALRLAQQVRTEVVSLDRSSSSELLRENRADAALKLLGTA